MDPFQKRLIYLLRDSLVKTPQRNHNTGLKQTKKLFQVRKLEQFTLRIKNSKADEQIHT